MTLTDRIVLEVDIHDENDQLRTGKFELQEDLDRSAEIARDYLMGARGNSIRQIVDVGSDLLPDDLADIDLDNRKGYWVDGGGGQYINSVSGVVGPGDSPWGDGSTAAGEASKYDAGGDVPLVLKKQVLEWYLSQARSDSLGRTRLHIGGWTDGSYSDKAGVFEEPLTVAIPEARFEDSPDDPSEISVTLECAWADVFPESVVDAGQDVLEEAGDLIPDF